MCCCWWELWNGEWTEWKEVGKKEAYKGRLCFSAEAIIFFLLGPSFFSDYFCMFWSWSFSKALVLGFCFPIVAIIATNASLLPPSSSTFSRIMCLLVCFAVTTSMQNSLAGKGPFPPKYSAAACGTVGHITHWICFILSNFHTFPLVLEDIMTEGIMGTASLPLVVLVWVNLRDIGWKDYMPIANGET
jgi:hypothetical protein